MGFPVVPVLTVPLWAWVYKSLVVVVVAAAAVVC